MNEKEATPDLGRDTTTPDGKRPEEQPRWRQDFPVDQPQFSYISRRDAARFLIVTSAAMAAAQLTLVLQSVRRGDEAAQPMAIARADEIPVGGSKVFQYPEGSGPRILVRVSEEVFVAYEQECTHLLCPVIPEPEEGIFHCPCHEGAFDLMTGRPISGPPDRPLARVTLEVRDGTIYATGIERRTV